jgi:hypothetical protein
MDSYRARYLRSNLNKLQIDLAAKKINKEIPLVADVLDIDASGIKVRLTQPLKAKIEDKVKIQFTLPGSGSKLTVHGTLKDQQPNPNQLSLIEDKVSIDDLVYDCVKLSDTTLLIKTV